MTVVDTPPSTQEAMLRAKASSGVHVLAGAISAALKEKGRISVSAIGASAVNQACKAIAISRGHLAVQGHDVVMAPGMENTTDNARPGTSGGDELTRLVFRVWISDR